MTKKQLRTLCSDYLFSFDIFFRINKKIPRGPPSPPAPVMHSPSRKVILVIFNFIKSPSAYGYMSPWRLNFVLQDQIWTRLGLQNSVLMRVFVNTCCFTASDLASALSGSAWRAEVWDFIWKQLHCPAPSSQALWSMERYRPAFQWSEIFSIFHVSFPCG